MLQYGWISKINIFKYSTIFIKFNDEMGVAMKMTLCRGTKNISRQNT